MKIFRIWLLASLALWAFESAVIVACRILLHDSPSKAMASGAIESDVIAIRDRVRFPEVWNFLRPIDREPARMITGCLFCSRIDEYSAIKGHKFSGAGRLKCAQVDLQARPFNEARAGL